MGGSRRLISIFFYGRLLCIHQIVYPMDGDKNKGFKGSSCSYIRGEPRAYRKPRPFYTNSIAGSRLPAVVEKINVKPL